MTPAALAAAASRHASVRWVGAPLLLTGLFGLVNAIISLPAHGTWADFGLGMFGTGLALASFGANNDAALALALQAQEATPGGGTPLNPELARELAEELAADQAGVSELKASPRVALVLPFVCLAVQAGLAWRLLGG